MFVGREIELKYLEDKYLGNGTEFVVLYGRRRIGKTELLAQFLKDKNYMFYTAAEVDDYEQRKRFGRQIEQKLGLKNFSVKVDTWDDLFRALKEINSSEKLIVAIDEFPYMVNSNKSIPSILQNLWDHELKHLNLMLILTGSSVSVMLDDILGAKNPLYGRITGSYKLKELPLTDVAKFFPNYSKEDIVTAYSVLGGVPQYLLQFNPEIGLEENIKQNILTKGTYLYDEVQMLMKQELREATTYFTLLEAIALGNTKLNEIHKMTQIDKTKINTYLTRLIHLDIIKREYPVTEKLKKKANVQSGLYQLNNNFFKFYFKYIFPNVTLLELNGVDVVYNNFVEKDLPIHVSTVFEEICNEYVLNLNVQGKLPVFMTNCGRWWQKGEEIDAVAFNRNNQFIFGECKWRNEKTSIKVLQKLQNKVAIYFKTVETVKFYLFSKSGFENELVNYAGMNNDVELVDLEELL